MNETFEQQPTNHSEVIRVNSPDSGPEDKAAKENLLNALEGFDSHESQNKTLRPKTSIRCGAGFLESQSLDIIDARDEGNLQAECKLLPEQYDKVANALNGLCSQKEWCSSGNIEYKSMVSDEESVQQVFNMGGAWQINYDGVSIKIAKPGGNETTKGLVHIEIPHHDKFAGLTDKRVAQLGNVLRNVLHVEKGISAPTAEEEQQAKQQQFEWHYLQSSNPDQTSSLRQEEVVPGHTAFIETGKSKEYAEKFGRYAVFHELGNENDLIAILSEKGLYSLHERYSRGNIDRHAASSIKEDFTNGSADGVFTRIVSEKGLQDSNAHDPGVNKPTIVFDNSVLDRTDWYAYNDDYFGTKKEPYFSLHRRSPEQVFKAQQLDGYRGKGEQVFPAGISADKIRAVFVPIGSAANLIAKLHKAGITEVNGNSVNELIIEGDKHAQFIQ